MNNTSVNYPFRLRQVLVVFLALVFLMGNLNGVVHAKSSVAADISGEDVENQAPIANSMSITTWLEEGVDISLTGSDPDGDALTFSIQRQPQHGEFEGEAPDLVYYPDSNFEGNDSFTFVVNDGFVDSEEATVNISVIAYVNYPPVANNQSVTTLMGETVGITLTGFDPNGDNLRFWIMGAPQHGVLRGTAPDLTYVPNMDFVGDDSFTFIVNDWSVDSRLAKVSITVYQEVNNHQPTANSQNLTINEDMNLSIVLTGADEDNDTLNYIILQNPSHGALSGTGSEFVYTPNVNFYGEDSFSFVTNDGTANSAEAWIFISVTPVNDQPTVHNFTVTTNEDVALNITLTAGDVDRDTLRYSIVSQPSHGVLSGVAPNLTYTPDADYYGIDSFRFKVNDGTIDSTVATVTIIINPVYDPPAGITDPVTGIEDWVIIPRIPKIPRQIYFDNFKPGLGVIRKPL